MPPVHALPQAPQFELLVSPLTHCDPQVNQGAVQSHTPATHGRPPVQTRPQAPQFDGFEVTSMQLPLQ